MHKRSGRRYIFAIILFFEIFIVIYLGKDIDTCESTLFVLPIMLKSV